MNRIAKWKEMELYKNWYKQAKKNLMFITNKLELKHKQRHRPQCNYIGENPQMSLKMICFACKSRYGSKYATNPLVTVTFFHG